MDRGRKGGEGGRKALITKPLAYLTLLPNISSALSLPGRKYSRFYICEVNRLKS